MPFIVSVAWGLAVFGFWTWIVGNDQLFHTLLGLGVAIFSGAWVHWKLRELIKARGSDLD